MKVPPKKTAPPPGTDAPVAPLRAEFLRAAALTALTLILLSLSFPPIRWWPLAFVGLVPWTIAICRAQRTWLSYWTTYFGGCVFFWVNLYWMYPVTDLGYVALSMYLAIYWTLAEWAVRTGLRIGVGPVLMLPIAWVACEFLRGWVMSGFPWLFLAHGAYRITPLIQIADLGGAYGVSFLMAMCSGALAECFLRRLEKKRPLPHAHGRALRPILAVGLAVVTAAGVIGYGYWRISGERFREGPLVVVLQEDFPLYSHANPGDPDVYDIFARYFVLAARAAVEHKPDLLVFPETVWGAIQNREFLERPLRAPDDTFAGMYPFSRKCEEATVALARGDYAAVNRVLEYFDHPRRREKRGALPRIEAPSGPPVRLVVGSVSMQFFPDSTYAKQKRFNSALVYEPDGTQRRERYDKIHLVPFGEIVPFRNMRVWGIDLHWLYRRLNELSPFSQGGKVEYSLWPGAEHTVFETAGAGTPRFGTPICYEDAMPYAIRDYVWGGGTRRVDFLLNLSNDGWFLHSAELEQHLASSVFRAVENRVAIARAVNTGVSGFIDPAGRVSGLVERDGRILGPGIIGYSAQRILLDDRKSAYGVSGDWFALGCVAISSLLWLGGIITRWILASVRAVRELVRRWAGRSVVEEGGGHGA